MALADLSAKTDIMGSNKKSRRASPIGVSQLVSSLTKDEEDSRVMAGVPELGDGLGEGVLVGDDVVVFGGEVATVSEAGGVPPGWLTFERGPRERRFYFENLYGERWVAHAGPAAVRLTGDDVGWMTLFYDAKLYDNYLRLYRQELSGSPGQYQAPGGMVLDPDEAAWMISVLTVALQLRQSVRMEEHGLLDGDIR